MTNDGLTDSLPVLTVRGQTHVMSNIQPGGLGDRVANDRDVTITCPSPLSLRIPLGECFFV